MSDFTTRPTTLQATAILSDARQDQDKNVLKIIGPQLVQELMRMLQQAQLFGPEHPQVRQLAESLCVWLHESMNRTREDQFSLQLTENNVFFNGHLMRFDEAGYARSMLLRALFLTYSVNQLTIDRGVTAGEWVALVAELKRAREKKNASLDHFSQPHLQLMAVSQRALDEHPVDDERREIIEIYAGLVIKCASYFQQLRTNPDASARFIKRLIQKAADKFVTHRHVFIGLINLKLIQQKDFVHAVNTAMYAMFIAQEVQLDRKELVRVGMTAITQDVHRVLQAARMEDLDPIELGQQSHFQTNMTSVTALSQMGASDVLSALRLVTSYERGFPYNKPLPEAWYKEKMRPHLLSRIVEIARHYDMLLQGLTGQKPLSPDLALQAMSEQMGRHYDPKLAKLFINLIGIYPVGEIVLLSSNEQALVVRSPSVVEAQSNKSVAHRPVVKLLDGSERLIDLGRPEHATLKIMHIVDPAEVAQRPGAFFFF